MQTMKKVISFDLDGTLVDARYGDFVWNLGIPDEYSKRYSISRDDAGKLVMAEYGSIGDRNILWYEIDHWLKRFDLSATASELLDRYEDEIEILPGVEEVLEYLKDRYVLVISSNAARIFVEKELRHTGLSRYFTHVFSATTDYRMVKKGPLFYERLCHQLHIAPGEMAHVGDHPIFDFEAPISMGIVSYCYRSKGSRHLDDPIVSDGGNIIHDFRELLNYL